MSDELVGKWVKVTVADGVVVEKSNESSSAVVILWLVEICRCMIYYYSTQFLSS